MARILIVDDEDDVRRSLGRILGKAKHDCLFASDAAEALEQLERSDCQLVLTDINMPGISGIELATKVQEKHPEVALAIVTGIDDPEVAEVALSRGAYGYLIKPLSVHQVLITVSNALRRRQLELDARQQRERLEQAVVQRTLELKASEQQTRRTWEEMVQRLAKAAEFRDDESREHVQRVGEFCALLARELELPAERVETIRLASLLHDVGKIGIPDRILLKPGKLSVEEFDRMKKHSKIGHGILAGSEIPLLDVAATIALTHHEKWDGSGYPGGLAATDIPLEGRITAIADVFDAVTSRRVYKEAMPIEKAVEILEEGKGTHFEPKLVQLFLGQLDEVKKIKAKLADTAPARYDA